MPLVATAVSIIVSVSLVAALVAYLWKLQISNSAVKCPPERLGKLDFACLPTLSGSIRLGLLPFSHSHSRRSLLVA